MPISITSNTAAFDAVQNLQLTSQSFIQAVQRLSSGLRINSAADDPSGLGLSQKLVAQINGLDQAQRNTQDAVSLLQTAQSGLNETMADLQRLNQLAVQAANGTLSSSDRQNIQLETQGLIQDVDRVAQHTKYNTKALLNGAIGASVSGGGPDMTDVQVQAGVTANGTYANSGARTNATQSAIQGNSIGSGTFLGGGSVTITGPTGVSQTFTSFAGEAVSNFVSQVNNANLGVTLQTLGGQYVLNSNNFGIAGGGNATGAQVITATGTVGDSDFGNGAGGAQMELIAGSGATTGSIVAGAFNGAAAVNGAITFGGVNTTLQGPNSDQFNGTGAVAGITFTVPNPGSISTVANADTITVTQSPLLSFQIGADAGTNLGLGIDAQTSLSLGVNAIDMTTQTGAQKAITTVQNAISQVSATLTNLGAIQSTLASTENLDSAKELDAQTANSNLVDANIPQEAVNFARAQILEQAGTAVLAQANQSAAGVLGLFNPGGPVL